MSTNQRANRDSPEQHSGSAHAEPVLPDTTSDEHARGWGEDGAEDRDAYSDEWYRRERPPHHGD